MAKRKIIAHITEGDHFQLTNQAQLSSLSNLDIQSLIEQMTLSVVPHPNRPTQYYLLSPAADFSLSSNTLIRQHCKSNCLFIPSKTLNPSSKH
ncbi:hypothetical protein [Photobacterium leiognathi]|uniref:hypothetical protein n=1 Tax=Photobacterium leiognathi TaxID=553611 RepID=UPI003AF333F3